MVDDKIYKWQLQKLDAGCIQMYDDPRRRVALPDGLVTVLAVSAAGPCMVSHTQLI